MADLMKFFNFPTSDIRIARLRSPTLSLHQEMVFNWVTQMVDYCELIPRLVPDCESYAKVIGQTPEIVDLISRIRDVMDDNHHSCQLLQDNFMK